MKIDINVLNAAAPAANRWGAVFLLQILKTLVLRPSNKKIIETGYISIDWWDEKDGPLYFLRMRHIDASVVDPSYGGQCCKLTPIGCTFNFEHRPYGGKSLIPKTTYNGRCTMTYSKHDCAVEWTPYAAILTRLYEAF